MLAIATTSSLIFLNPTSLKSNDPSSPSPTPLPLASESPPTTVVWSPDSSSLFIAFSDGIYTYTPNSPDDPPTLVYKSDSEGPPVRHLQAKDKGNTLLFSQSHQIHILESGKLAKTLGSHSSPKSEASSPITSLCLSNDSTLLASTTTTSAHIHNLTLSSHTVLRGIPTTSNGISTCSFHPHSRTRLLLGVGQQFVVYDTTRSSSPAKVVALPEEMLGYIIAIACSPFSKTLVAIATSGGFVALVDLEKDKNPRCTFPTHAPITSLLFSQEGDSLYIGTENGKLLIQSLRGLDKPPKILALSEGGERIEGMALQKKPNNSTDPIKSAVSTAVTTTTTSRAPALSKKPSLTTTTTRNITSPRGPSSSTTTSRVTSTTSRLASSTTSLRVTTTTTSRVTSTGTPRRPSVATPRRTSAATPRRVSKPAVSTPARRAGKPPAIAGAGKVFSPVRDPLGNGESGEDISMKIETLVDLRKSTTRKENARLAGKGSPPPRLPTSKSIPSSLSSPSANVLPPSKSLSPQRLTVPNNDKPRTRAVSTSSSISRVATGPGGTRRVVSSSSVPSNKSPSSSVSARSGTTGNLRENGKTGLRETSSKSTLRTSSPDLPAMDGWPITPFPLVQAKAKAKVLEGEGAVEEGGEGKEGKVCGLKVLGRGMQEVDAWLEAGRRSANDGGRKVGFVDPEDKEERDEGREEEEETSTSLQISPRRPLPISPSRFNGSNGIGGGNGGNAAQMLSSLLHSALGTYHAETADALTSSHLELKSSLTNIHLDLLSMQRGWKGAFEEFAEGEVRELREENRRLRDENWRLRERLGL
ncbi:hypothetical protein JAAARDRAFT_77142 [Jaapia argillacea MUCL 33604]|uniref:Uncharacterized protein n=1 Tax=Jaapia argillacea MUCL 33604 TaxID=933084 RepID=A0A067Q295_9AGAM|nr:hypothetical protein JAAARDRAFT_77142 [Jaapia argillacea MUCL 33604]